MELGDLLTIDGVVPSLRVRDKKEMLRELSRRAVPLTGLAERDIYDALLQRERLGSTGFGRGIAIPHVTFRALRNIACIFARMDVAIPFDALDGEPVDIIFLLLGPEHASGDHLKALARISRLVRDPKAVEALRSTRDRDALFALLTQRPTSHAA